MVIYVMSVLLIIAIFSVLIVPVIATLYLYRIERRLIFFKFISVKEEPSKSELESKLTKICFVFESASKICVFIFVVLMVIRILTR